jgi:hypothetical protein
MPGQTWRAQQNVAGAEEVTEGVATGALAEGVATGEVAAGVLERAVAVRVAAIGLDAVGVLGEHAAATAIKVCTPAGPCRVGRSDERPRSSPPRRWPAD